MPLNQKLTDKPQKTTLTSAALIHVVEPDDFSQGADGSDYKVLVDDLLPQAGQDNIDIRKNVNILSTDTYIQILAKINALANYTVNEKQSVWFICRQVTTSVGQLPRTIKYKMMLLGKGNYGTGGTQLTFDNLENIFDNTSTLLDIENDPTTDKILYGDLVDETISEWLNVQDPAIVIQPQEDGYTLFEGTINGVDVSYLWIGEGGVYGLGDTQSTMADFQIISNEEGEPETIVPRLGMAENPPSELNTTSYDAFPLYFETPTGKVLLIHYQGTEHAGVASTGVRVSLDKGATYGDYTPIINVAGKYNGISGGGITPTGRIVLFYFIATPGVGTDEIGYFYSDDDAVTWSDRVPIPMGINTGGGPTGKMLTLAENKLMQCWFGTDGPPNVSGTNNTLYAVFSTDNGTTWGNQVIIAAGSVDAGTAWTECSFVYLEGSALVGLVRRDASSYYVQFKSEDNGETFTNQGNATFDFFDYQSAPELNVFFDLDGKRTVVAYWANRSPDLKLRAIYGRNLLNGVSGWDVSTRVDIATLLNDDSGYPSVIHSNGSIYGLGVYYQGKSASDADLQFFKYPVLEAKISDTSVWDAKIGGSGTTNALPKFTSGSVLGDSNLFDTGTGQVGLFTASPSGIGSARVLNHAAPSGVSSQYILEGNNGVQFVSVLSGQASDNLPTIMFNNGLRIAVATAKDATGYAEWARFEDGNLKLSNDAVDPEDAINLGQADAKYLKLTGETGQAIEGSISVDGIDSSTGGIIGGSIETASNIKIANAPTDSDHGTRKDYVDPVNNVNGAGTLALATTNKQMFYTFTGTTSTWTLPVVSGNTLLRYTLINAGSGNITLNSNAGANDILDAGATVNTKTIASGAVITLYNNGTNFVVITQ